MADSKYVLEVKDLHTSFFTDAGEVKAVNGVSFNLEPGKTLGIVYRRTEGKDRTNCPGHTRCPCKVP